VIDVIEYVGWPDFDLERNASKPHHMNTTTKGKRGNQSLGAFR
jgi:hypothetical protein